MSLAASKADKARPTWIGLREGFGLFLVLCVVFFTFTNFEDPFGGALLLTLALMVIVPAVTALAARSLNEDYDRCWYCETCGELWASSDTTQTS